MLSIVLLASLLTTGLARATSTNRILNSLEPIPGVSFRAATAHRPHTRTPIPPTQNSHQLKALTHSRSGARSAAAVLGAHQRQVNPEGKAAYVNISSATVYGTEYAIPLTFGNQTFLLSLDTGSSDTWVVGNNYDCVDFGGDVLPSEWCGFGPPFKGGFASGAQDEGLHLYIAYADGEIAYGPMGQMDVTVGGIAVRNQTVGLANQTYWYGNNVTSGVLGLAYPSLTNAYFGEGDEHNPVLSHQYMPLFTNMVQQGLEPGLFTVAISRNSSGGAIAFGGYPFGLPGLDYSSYAVCDIIIADLIDTSVTSVDYSFYTVIPDGFLFGSGTDSEKFPVIVDTGTTLMYFPSRVADAINAMFDPPATYNWLYGGYFTACDAVAPPFAVILDGSPFYMNPVDMIYRQIRDAVSGECMTAISDGGSGPFILGNSFLQNVVVSFDIDNAQVSFISRRFY